MENEEAVIDINFSSRPCRENIARPPMAARGVVQAGHPGVKVANKLPNAVDLVLPLMVINCSLASSLINNFQITFLGICYTYHWDCNKFNNFWNV